MSEKKHELILFAIALAASAVLILFNTFTAPDMRLSSDKKDMTHSVTVPSAVVSEESNVIVNINFADIDELSLIKGVGEAKAQAIIDYRMENGLFESVDELIEVSGIGEKLLEKIKPFVTV